MTRTRLTHTSAPASRPDMVRDLKICRFPDARVHYLAVGPKGKEVSVA